LDFNTCKEPSLGLQGDYLLFVDSFGIFQVLSQSNLQTICTIRSSPRTQKSGDEGNKKATRTFEHLRREEGSVATLPWNGINRVVWGWNKQLHVVHWSQTPAQEGKVYLMTEH
jgi:hypothetical protein